VVVISNTATAVTNFAHCCIHLTTLYNYYKLLRTNRYYVTGFKGTKSLVLSTVSRMGGKNEFIGAAYIALGALSLAIALAFAIKHWTNPRKLGDTRFLVMQDTE
jgi:LEM3 (ligand-effect modulator 3) family / CDC50 family